MPERPTFVPRFEKDGPEISDSFEFLSSLDKFGFCRLEGTNFVFRGNLAFGFDSNGFLTEQIGMGNKRGLDYINSLHGNTGIEYRFRIGDKVQDIDKELHKKGFKKFTTRDGEDFYISRDYLIGMRQVEELLPKDTQPKSVKTVETENWVSKIFRQNKKCQIPMIADTKSGLYPIY